jgi:hypothetical protein
MLSITVLLAVSAGPIAAAQDIVEVSDLGRAVERTVASETASVAVQVVLEDPAGSIEPMLLMDVTGQFAFGGELRARLEGEMLEIGPFTFISDGEGMYLRGELVDGLLAPGQWLYVDTSAPPPGFEELQGSFEVGSDAALVLYWLLGVDGPIKVLGSEPLGDVEAVHVELPIDLGRVRAEVPSWLLPAYERNLAGLREARADVDRAHAWLGVDGLIRRITYEMPFAFGDELGLITVGYDLWGFGETLDVTAPHPADVVDASELVGGE